MNADDSQSQFNTAELASMARDEKYQPEVYLAYLLGWLTFIGVIVLVVFPILDTTIGILLIAILLGAYVAFKYYFGKHSIFTS